jgi:hypothetical protein
MKDHDFLFHICTKKKKFLTVLEFIVDIYLAPQFVKYENKMGY